MNREAGYGTAAPEARDGFSDPYAPELPERVFGVDTRIIMGLGQAAMGMDALPPGIRHSLASLPDALRVISLVERLQSEVNPRHEDAPAGDAPERELSPIEIAREKVAAIEEDVRLVASFENPREQFVDELDMFASAARAAASEHRDMRVENNIPAEPPAGPGLKGFAVTVYRQVRRFFDFLRGRPVVNPEITAYDVAAGIDKTVRSLLNGSEALKEKLPFLSGLIPKRVSADKLPSLDRMAFLAPEILTSIFSPLSANKDNDELLKSVNGNPHEFRFVTRFVKSYKGVDLRYIQRTARTLLPAVRDVMPTNGPQIGMIFNLADKFLNPKKLKDAAEERKRDSNPEPEPERTTKKRAWRRFLRPKPGR